MWCTGIFGKNSFSPIVYTVNITALIMFLVRWLTQNLVSKHKQN
jgi:hypothetical protein